MRQISKAEADLARSLGVPVCRRHYTTKYDWCRDCKSELARPARMGSGGERGQRELPMPNYSDGETQGLDGYAARTEPYQARWFDDYSNELWLLRLDVPDSTARELLTMWLEGKTVREMGERFGWKSAETPHRRLAKAMDLLREQVEQRHAFEEWYQSVDGDSLTDKELDELGVSL